MARKIVITSGKGGVGKTTICANLGSIISYDYSVCLIDGDIGLNNLDVVMGIENNVVYDILDVVSGRCRPQQALVRDIKSPNLFVLPSVRGGDIGLDNFIKIIESLDKLFDFILIDCPAGMDVGFHRAVTVSDEAIVVSTPNISSIRDADKTISTLNTYHLDNIYLVINMIRGDLVATGEMFSVADISRLLRMSPVGVIPADDDVILANTTTIYDRTKSTRAFNMLKDNILGKTTIIYDETKGYKGALGKLRSRLKRIL